MISKTELGRVWASIIPGKNQTVGKRADVSHPLDFYATLDENQNMQLLLLTDFHPDLPASNKQIHVRGNIRQDGNYAICFSLINSSLRDQFLSLCWDLMDCTFAVQNKRNGVQKTLNRFRLWQKLFSEVGNRRLSEAQVKGLIGELSILQRICIPKYGAERALRGWIGPLGGDRDFEYEDQWFESKCISLSRDKVKISSFEQLDTECPGYLVITRAEKGAPEVNESVTLTELVHNVLALVGDDPVSKEVLKTRLMLYGFSEGEEYANEPYVIKQLEYYKVEPMSFPRLRRSEIHSAVTNGEYSLSIPALQQWRADSDFE